MEMIRRERNISRILLISHRNIVILITMSQVDIDKTLIIKIEIMAILRIFVKNNK